ncbi:SixA phosphatase family protein [Tropicimonas sp. S265A]|uniref:SixA phosphatase family protein n=1 Tax=Tropicimonas sp. S265A TaxID=3415134 RepID=UPI003C7ACF38
MKTLLVLRHAKSSWTDPGRDDHERPLNARGRRGAAAIGAWIAEEGLLPDQVLCSDAVRTQETWARTGLPGAADLKSELYHASADTVLETVRAASGKRVLVIGHNPGLAEFSSAVAVSPSDHHRFAQYPTGALSVLTFDTEAWGDVDWKSGKLTRFLTPHDLGVRK